jgi:hypothetical protein
MTTGAAPGSSRITLFGIALIWMTAQALVAVAHDFWISRGGHRNTSGQCEPFGPIAVIGRGWLVGRTVFVPFKRGTPSPDAKI